MDAEVAEAHADDAAEKKPADTGAAETVAEGMGEEAEEGGDV